MFFFFILASQIFAHSLNMLLLKPGPEKKWWFWLFNIAGSLVLAFSFQLFNYLTVVPTYFFQLALFYYTSDKNRDYLFYVPLGLILGIIGDYFSNYLSLVVLQKMVVRTETNGAIAHLLLAFLLAAGLAWGIRKLFAANIASLPRSVMITATNLLLWTYYLLIFIDRSNASPEVNHKLETLFFALYSIIMLVVLYNYSRILEAQYTQKTIKLQEDYIKKLENSYQQLRTFKHDYHNILYTLHSYIEDEDLAQLKAYYQQNILPTNLALEDRPVNLKPLENLPVNLKSLMTIKLLEASNKNLTVQLTIPEMITIKDSLVMDLSEALGIILDNAMEEMAKNKTHHPLIVSFLSEQKKMTITIKNPTTTELSLHQLKQASFSTKGEQRGNGLTILDSIINRNPTMRLRTQLIDQEFTQQIIILRK